MKKLIRLARAALICAACGDGALAQPTAGEVRTLIGPDAAIDAPTYRQYQECLARVPLNQDLNRAAAARDACRQRALEHAYRVPNANARDDKGYNAVPTVKERSAAQERKLESFKDVRR